MVWRVPNLNDYSGATGRLEPDAGLKLDPKRYAWQPKVDGCFVRVATDDAGCVSSLLMRCGNPVPARDVTGIAGMHTGLPNAVLHGELEAHTEAGIAARKARGFPVIHLFDCARFLGNDVKARPYTERYGLLHRWQADLECYRDEPGAPVERFYLDGSGRAHLPASHVFVDQAPRDIRRLPIVKLARGAGAAEQLWDEHVVRGGGEGLVAVRLDARLGQRQAKLKIKEIDTLDCVVIQRDSSAAMLSWAGRQFAVSAKGKWQALQPGDVVEVACNGFYNGGKEPRFARIVRIRQDKVVTE